MLHISDVAGCRGPSIAHLVRNQRYWTGTLSADAQLDNLRLLRLFTHWVYYDFSQYCTHRCSNNRKVSIKLYKVIDKKAFESKANRPLGNRYMGYIVNKYEYVQEGEGYRGGRRISQVNKFEYVYVWSHSVRHDWKHYLAVNIKWHVLPFSTFWY